MLLFLLLLLRPPCDSHLVMFLSTIKPVLFMKVQNEQKLWITLYFVQLVTAVPVCSGSVFFHMLMLLSGHQDGYLLIWLDSRTSTSTSTGSNGQVLGMFWSLNYKRRKIGNVGNRNNFRGTLCLWYRWIVIAYVLVTASSILYWCKPHATVLQFYCPDSLEVVSWSD